MKWVWLESLVFAVVIALVLVLLADDFVRVKNLKPGGTCPICHQVVQEAQ